MVIEKQGYDEFISGETGSLSLKLARLALRTCELGETSAMSIPAVRRSKSGAPTSGGASSGGGSGGVAVEERPGRLWGERASKRNTHGVVPMYVCDVGEMVREPEMMIDRRSVTQVSVLGQTQTRFV